jgi:hypothetical protein
VQYFYTGLSPLSKSQVDSSAGGSIIGKSVQQTLDLFELIATTHSMFSSERVVPPRAPGMYEMDNTASTNAQIAALTKQVELLVKSQTRGAHAVLSSVSCENCGANHETESCMSMGFPEERVNFIQNGSRNFNPYSQTYNPGWKQHPNFRWSDTQPGNAPNNAQLEKKPSLGEMFNQYMQRTDKVFQQIDTNFQNQQASIKKLETQIGQIAQQLTERPQGTLPGNTMINPKEQVQAITTRSGVQLPEIHVQRPNRREKEAEVEGGLEKEQAGTHEHEDKKEKEEPAAVRAPSPVKAYVPPIPFPQRLQKRRMDKQFAKFVEIFKKLQINIPFADAIAQMPSYAKFLKEILANKRKLEEHETVCLNEECSAVLLKKLPPKLRDPGSFTIPCTIGSIYFERSLCDLGASVNLMPLSVYRSLGLGEAKPTTISLQLADRSIKRPKGIVEDVLVKVDKFIFPADFIILDMEEDSNIPLILGRPFLATGRALIDVYDGKMILRMDNEQVIFNMFKAMKHPLTSDTCCQVDALDELVTDVFHATNPEKDHEANDAKLEEEKLEGTECMVNLVEQSNAKRHWQYESLGSNPTPSVPSVEKAPSLELKPLPSHLRYAYLGDASTLPVIIASDITTEEEKKLLGVLREHKTAIGWTIADIRGISPTLCMHKILMEDESKPSVEGQRRLNPTLKEVVRKEVLKLLDAGIIYPISDSSWVSPVHVVPKKGGITVEKNENNELIPTRLVTGWRVCIDYRKLNNATRKDHFPLPFIDQMLERLAGHSHYCFLDGYSGYNQIAIAPEDQEKTTFTCPYGTFAFRRMPFGLCNAPATFQRCMMAIFSDMVEKYIEIFMDDFSVFGDSFDDCLERLSLVL